MTPDTNRDAIAHLLFRLTQMRSPLGFDPALVEEATQTIQQLMVRLNGLERALALYHAMLQTALPFVDDVAHDPALYNNLADIVGTAPSLDRLDLLPAEWSQSVLDTIKRLGVGCTPEVLAHAITQTLAAQACRIEVSAKSFKAPGAWFPTDVLGNPIREFAPGKWESWARPHPVESEPPLTSG